MRIKIIEDKGKTKSIKFSPGDICYFLLLENGMCVVENATIYSVDISFNGIIEYKICLSPKFLFETKHYVTVKNDKVDKTLFKDFTLAKEQADYFNAFL